MITTGRESRDRKSLIIRDGETQKGGCQTESVAHTVPWALMMLTLDPTVRGLSILLKSVRSEGPINFPKLWS